MAKAKQPVSINGIEFDALIDQDVGFTATVPEYPVENGFSVSDAILLSAETLTMTLYLTNTPVTWYQRHGNDPGRVERVVKQLEELYFSKTPVTVVTSDETFTNMGITALNIRKSVEVGYAREIPISFKKIRTTQATTTVIPASYGKAGATGAQAGSANTTNGSTAGDSSSGSGSGSSDNSKASILYSAAKGIGLIQ